MKGLADNTRVAVDGLLANKLRSGLTMLGVVIGVAAVVALLSIGQGASASITERIESAGTNLLFVSPGSMNRGPVRGPMGSATTLTFNDADALADPANVPDASSVAPEFSSRAQIIVGNNNTNVSVTGVTPEYAEVLGLSMAEGEFVSDSNVNRRSTVAVLGSGVAEELFGGVDPLGSKIKIASTDASGRRLLVTVVGVLEEKGESMLSDPDSSVFVPITTAQNRLFDGRNARGEPIVSRINVAARSDDLTDAVSEQIDATLRGTHGLASTDDADFNVMSL
ncbi:MAG: ABC transporter permease, partial [Anaerolineae bacterium]